MDLFVGPPTGMGDLPARVGMGVPHTLHYSTSKVRLLSQQVVHDGSENISSFQNHTLNLKLPDM